MSSTDADPDLLDQRVYLHGVSWEDYERLLLMRGEKSVPRITYLDGEVELMSPSQQHEWIGKTIGRLLETWGEESGIDLIGFGSWTLKKRRRRRGLEADECFVIGAVTRTRPDLAIEVIWTSGGIDKLKAYLAIEVPEVWFWQDGRISIHALQGGRYREQQRSLLLPDLDLPELLSFLEQENPAQAQREYRALLQRRRGRG